MSLICKFCNKECKNPNSLRNHERLCKLNPDRQLTAYEKYGPINNFNNKGRLSWNKGLTKETDSRLAKIAYNRHIYFINHPEKKRFGFSANSKKSRYKYGTYAGYYCDSSWELAFIIWCLDHDIYPERNTKQWFEYTAGDKVRKFYPDFIIANIYYEIKGGYDIYAADKINQFPWDKKLIVLDNISIRPYLDYAIEKYGKDFYTVYDKEYPSWMDKEKS